MPKNYLISLRSSMVQSQWHPEKRNAAIVKSQHKDEWININIKLNKFSQGRAQNFKIKAKKWK